MPIAPFLQVVPLATLPIGTREPLLQMENEFPSLEQTICPSVQDPALPFEVGLSAVPEAGGVGLGDEPAGDGSTAIGVDAGVTGGGVLTLLSDESPETGLIEGEMLEDTLVEEGLLGGVLLGEVSLEEDSLLGEDEDPDPLRNGAEPLQAKPGPGTLPCKSDPGSGKATSSSATVVHSPSGLLILARKIGGRLLKASRAVSL